MSFTKFNDDRGKYLLIDIRSIDDFNVKKIFLIESKICCFRGFHKSINIGSRKLISCYNGKLYIFMTVDFKKYKKIVLSSGDSFLIKCDEQYFSIYNENYCEFAILSNYDALISKETRISPNRMSFTTFSGLDFSTINISHSDWNT